MNLTTAAGRLTPNGHDPVLISIRMLENGLLMTSWLVPLGTLF
jgi:hypothetical protein